MIARSDLRKINNIVNKEKCDKHNEIVHNIVADNPKPLFQADKTTNKITSTMRSR